MTEHLLAPFQYDFMQRALVASVIVGGLCSLLGTYVVLRKLSFIGDGIAHASFAGIVIAYLRGINFELGAACVAIATALGIGYLNRRGRVSLDTAIGVLFTGAFALGVFLISRSRSSNVDLEDFLFGNILGVGSGDLAIDAAVALVVVAAVALFFRPLLFATFDPVVARSTGIPTAFLQDLLLVLLALTIVVSLESIGIVLVAALLVTPAAAAAQVTYRFSRMLALSIGIGIASCVSGLILSYYAGAASGATIVLIVTVVFFVFFGLGRRRRTAR